MSIGLVLQGGLALLELVSDCFALARPDTRPLFVTNAEMIEDTRSLCREIKAMCGRRRV